MKRTKDDIIAGVRRQNEYVLRHNRELREEVELLRKGAGQVKDSLHAVLLAMAKKCGSTQADGRVILRIPHPDIADAKQYAQHIENGDDGDTVITFTPIRDENQKKQKSDG
ncbi:MAG: hypothetical protein DBX93_05600 [Oscillospiraceae bacterium]|nr:MAG: hypothetical protein DBX93_05600 [Oscillospiraceae bacterium]